MDSKSYQEYVEEIDIQRYWLVLKRRWLPAALVFATCCAAGAVLYTSSKGDPFYRAKGKLLLRKERSTLLTGVGEKIGGIDTIGRSDPLENQQNIVRSVPVLKDVVDTLDIRGPEGEPLSPASLRESLVVNRQGQTDILGIEYFSADPNLASEVVNQVMASYVKRSIALNRSQATAAREFVEEQIPEARANLEAAAEALRQFHIENQIVDLDREASATVGQRSGMDSQIDAIEVSLARVSTQIQELQRQIGLSLPQARQANTLSESSGVQSVLTNLQEVQTLLASERSRYTEEHPTIAGLKRQEAALENLLLQRIESLLGESSALAETSDVTAVNTLQMNSLDRQLTTQLTESIIERQSLLSQLQELEETQTALSQRAASFPTLEKQLRELQQDLKIAQGTYERLLQKLEESRLAESQVVATANILEFAEPSDVPIVDSNQRLLMAGIAGGVLLGLVVAFLLDLIDKSIKTVKDGEALLGYTLLGLIPQFNVSSSNEDPSLNAGRQSPRIIVSGQSEPMAAAAYQMLQANLKFISSDAPQRAITITSSVAQEGKSEVCANLAKTIAQTGKHVLLVDADMRSPSQHHLWNVINQIGLSHVLVGEGQLSEALHQVDENLTLLTAGVTPPNPLALVDSERMGELVQSLLSEYDYVLFDTPPLIGAADAAMLGKVSDGVLLVLRPRRVDSASALSAKSLLSRSGANVLGLVANAVNIRDEHDDYVSQIKAGAYPYNQPATDNNRDRSLISLVLSGKNSADTDEDPFK